MGADGGVCWIKVRDEKRFDELVRPFGFLYFEDYHWSNWEWLEENREDDKVYSTYGTGQDLCLLDIPQVIGEIEEIQGEDPGHIYSRKDFHTFTFSDLATEWETRPKFYRSSLWVIDRIAKSLSLWIPEGWEDVKIVDWGTELSELVIEDSTGSVETWT